MKTLLKKFISKISNWIYFWIWFILSLLVFGLVYATYTRTTQTPVWVWSGLTATAWNTMINDMNYLKDSVDSKISSQWVTSWSNISYSWGNVGIGTPTPWSKLEVNWDLKVWGQIFWRISNEWEAKNIFASACIAWWIIGWRFITMTTINWQNCATACQNSYPSTCVWGVTFWAWNQFYWYNYECSTGVNYQQGSSGYICCCNQGVTSSYPIR